MSLFIRVERMNKDIVCVEEMGKRLGGYVLDKNSREEERRWCVACCVSVFYLSLFPFLPQVLHPDF
jgi:hypothetical protein